MMGNLAGLSVLVTRPQAQSENLAAYIIEQGGNPLIFPTLGIQAVAPTGGWQLAMATLASTDVVVFVSANAVREVMPHWPAHLPPTLKIAAIGRATAAALSEQGVQADAMPMSDYRSEGLLALSAFANLHGKKVIIFAGAGGRDYLESVLTERGAYVQKITVYRRYQPATDPDILLLFLERADPKIIISTSVESLENLLAMAKPVGDIKNMHLLVISERMKAFALQAGFTQVIVANQASCESLLADLKNWYAGWK